MEAIDGTCQSRARRGSGRRDPLLVVGMEGPERRQTEDRRGSGSGSGHAAMKKAGLGLKRPLEKQEFPREAGGGGGTPGRTSVGKGAA